MHNFKMAAKTTFIFLLVLTLFSAGIMEFYFQSENSYFQDYVERDELAGSLNWLIIGASRGERAFRAADINEDLGITSYNLSNPNMTAKGRYTMLKKEIARNPVDTVVMEVSMDTLRFNRKKTGPEGDFYLLSRMNSITERLKYFATSIYPSEYATAYYFYIDEGMTSIKRLIKGNYKTENTQALEAYGYRKYTHGSTDLTKSLKHCKKYYNTKHVKFTEDEMNVEYMEKIVALCKENNIRLIFATTMVSTYLICKTDNMDDYYNWYQDFCEENDIEYYDFNLLKNRGDYVTDKDGFKNNQHLSNIGSAGFSKAFSDIMEKVNAGEDVSSYFYQSYNEYEETQEYAK